MVVIKKYVHPTGKSCKKFWIEVVLPLPVRDASANRVRRGGSAFKCCLRLSAAARSLYSFFKLTGLLFHTVCALLFASLPPGHILKTEYVDRHNAGDGVVGLPVHHGVSI